MNTSTGTIKALKDTCSQLIMTNNLVIIITGYIRNFFDNDDFSRMYARCRAFYDDVLVICVLNSNKYDEDMSRLTNYFQNLKCTNLICNFSDHIDEYHRVVANKIIQERYIQQKKRYFSSYKESQQSIHDPDSYIASTVCVQQFQVKIGITRLLKYAEDNQCDFGVCMRTRFDCKYPDDFFPHIPEGDILDHITFNDHIKNIVTSQMLVHNLYTVEDLIRFNQTQRLHPPYGHIPNRGYCNMAFGGLVCHNYESLVNICHQGYDNTLYAFNDFYYFSKTAPFIKLIQWFDESCLLDSSNPDLYNHYFCAESQLIIFCLNNNINILMYPEYFYGINTFVNR